MNHVGATVAELGQLADQGEQSGRTQTRTVDLCRVNSVGVVVGGCVRTLGVAIVEL